MVSEGRSGLYPVWSWKSLRMKTAQPLWVICAPAWLALAGKKFSPHLQSELLLVLLVPAASHPPTTHHWRAWLHVLANPFAGTAGCCGTPPQHLIFSRLDKFQHLSHLWWPSTELTPGFSMSVLFSLIFTNKQQQLSQNDGQNRIPEASDVSWLKKYFLQGHDITSRFYSDVYHWHIVFLSLLILTFDIYSVSPSFRHLMTYLFTSHLRKKVEIVTFLYFKVIEIMERWYLLKYGHWLELYRMDILREKIIPILVLPEAKLYIHFCFQFQTAGMFNWKMHLFSIMALFCAPNCFFPVI